MNKLQYLFKYENLQALESGKFSALYTMCFVIILKFFSLMLKVHILLEYLK